MTSLYQLSAEFQAVAARLDESDLDEQTIADTLEGFAADLEDKVISVTQYIRNLESTAHSIKVAEEQMAQRRVSMLSKADSLKKYVMKAIEDTGIGHVDCPLFSVSVRKAPPALVVNDESHIPPVYFVQQPPPPPKLDKKALKDAIKSGLSVEGIELVSSKYLHIK